LNSYNLYRTVTILTGLSPEDRLQLADRIREQLNQIILGNGQNKINDFKNCPHCGCNAIVHWGQSHRLPRYRCQSCKRTFNLLTNTRLSRLRYRERWLTFAGTMCEKQSIRKSATACRIHSTTAHRWFHRFRGCAPLEKARMISTIIMSASSESLQAAAFDELPEVMSWWNDLLPALLTLLK